MAKENETVTAQKAEIRTLKQKLERMKFKLTLARLREEELDLAHADLWEEKYRGQYNLEIPAEEVLEHIGYRRGQELESGMEMLRHGYLIARRIKRLLAEEGVDDVKSVLDFGSGPGRVTRFLDCLGERIQIYGCDIDAQAIGWAQEHLAEVGTFFVSHDRPPIPTDVERFGAIVVFSVFTHLPEEMQFGWLEELAKRLEPGGLMLATFHGPSYHRFIPEADREIFEELGFVHSDLGKTPDLPDYYQTTFHSHEYIEKNWTKHFHLRRILAQEMNGQDVAILERV